jgi:hypothetical protein
MRQQKFIWSPEGADTVRLMPENYCIAIRTPSRRLTLDIDTAVNLELATQIFRYYHVGMHSWLPPLDFVDGLNKLLPTT